MSLLGKPVPIGQPYSRRGVRMVLARFTREKVIPIVSRDSGTVIGWTRVVEWYVRDVPVESLK